MNEAIPPQINESIPPIINPLQLEIDRLNDIIKKLEEEISILRNETYTEMEEHLLDKYKLYK
jgi:hypothetical protein